MSTRFLVTLIGNGYEVYLIVNGKAFSTEVIDVEDWRSGKYVVNVYPCCLNDVPTIGPSTGTVCTHWYIYEPDESIYRRQDIPSSYEARVAHMFFNERQYGMGSITKIE